MFRLQKGNSGVSFNKTLLNFGLRFNLKVQIMIKRKKILILLKLFLFSRDCNCNFMWSICKDGIARFLTVPLKLCLIKYELHINDHNFKNSFFQFWVLYKSVLPILIFNLEKLQYLPQY